MILCENCLETVPGRPVRFPIGMEFGSQRDPEHHELTLCQPCQKALIDHDLALFHARFSPARRVERSADEGGEA